MISSWRQQNIKKNKKKVTSTLDAAGMTVAGPQTSGFMPMWLMAVAAVSDRNGGMVGASRSRGLNGRDQVEKEGKCEGETERERRVE